MEMIHRYERFFLGSTIVMLGVGLFAVMISFFVNDIELPSPVKTVDPSKIASQEPFNNPGVFQVGENEYDAVIIAQAWAYNPARIEVPVGATVHFKFASVDVVHGVLVHGTTVNLTIIPGQVAEATGHFDEAGEFLYVCHEYCGIGHHNMAGRVVVK
jgi:cytochrome c oxidase subunit 2